MTLDQRVGAMLARAVDPGVREFAELLGREAGALGVLFYGSNLRTGSLDGVLDFYVLMPGGDEARIWPRVSYRERDRGGTVLRAKIATMTLAKFAQAASGKTCDTTIWARFVQPSALVWAVDEQAHAAIARAIGNAMRTAGELAAALGPREGVEEAYWRALFQATYAAEFRVEKAGREESILALNRAHFSGLLPQALEGSEVKVEPINGHLRITIASTVRQRILRRWARWRRLGKALNVVRLVKASTTFDGAARYAAWKIERHTGVPVVLTPWREHHPILAAPSVLWRVWRALR